MDSGDEWMVPPQGDREDGGQVVRILVQTRLPGWCRGGRQPGRLGARVLGF